jgi:hypothetical protein
MGHPSPTSDGIGWIALFVSHGPSEKIVDNMNAATSANANPFVWSDQ